MKIRGVTNKAVVWGACGLFLVLSGCGSSGPKDKDLAVVAKSMSHKMAALTTHNGGITDKLADQYEKVLIQCLADFQPTGDDATAAQQAASFQGSVYLKHEKELNKAFHDSIVGWAQTRSVFEADMMQDLKAMSDKEQSDIKHGSQLINTYVMKHCRDDLLAINKNAANMEAAARE